MEHFVPAGPHSDLDLLLQLLDLADCIVKLHLQVVTLKQDRLQMHLLFPDHIFLQLFPLLLDLFDALRFF